MDETAARQSEPGTAPECRPASPPVPPPRGAPTADHYRDLYEQAPVALLSVDLLGVIRDANRRAASLFGMADRELAGRAFADFVAQKHADVWRLHLERAAVGSEPDYVELRLEPGPGRAFDAAVESLAAIAPGAAQATVRTMVTDITERRRAEDYLMRTAEKFETLFNCAGDAIFICDADGRMLEANDVACSRLGYTHEELLALSPADIDVGNGGADAFERLRASLSSGSVVRETVHRAKDGTLILTEISAKTFEYCGSLAVLCVARDITDRKAAEQRLLLAQRQAGELKTIVDRSPVMAFRWRAEEGWPVEYCANTAGLLGYSPEELAGESILFADLIHPDDLPRVAAEVDGHVGCGNDDYHQEYRLRRADGVYRWFDDRTWVRRDAAGKVTHFHGVLLDVTEKKAAEDALRHSEETAWVLLNATSDRAMLLDRDLRIVGVNQAYAREWGCTDTEIVGRTVPEFPPPDCNPTRRDGVNSVVDSGVALSLDECVGGRHLHTSLSPVPGPDGKVAKVAVFVTDVTDVKRSQALSAALAACYAPLISPTSSLEDMSRVVLEQATILTESAHGFVSLIDRETGDNHVKIFSRAMPECCADSTQERVVLPGNPDGSYRGLWGHALNTREGFCTNSAKSHPACAGLPAGHVPVERFMAVPVLLGDELVGEIALANSARGYDGDDLKAIDRLAELYALGVQRKRTDDALESARQSAESASRAKSEFLANMSHEVRTPLNGIIGMTALALETTLTPEQQEYIEAVKASSEHLLIVINEILDFSKIEAQKLDLEAAPFLLRESIRTGIAPLVFRAHQKGIELDCDLPDEVPNALVGDAVRLTQVLVNLVGNAVKFTERGRIRLGAAVVPGPEEGVTIRFDVSDTGEGIPPDKMEVIFSPFAQADGSTTRRHGGTGLGLSISSRLAELMGGRLWAESTLGEGSVFHFTASFGLQNAPARRRSADITDPSGRPLLLVAPSEAARARLAAVLQGLDATLVGAADPATAHRLVVDAARSGAAFGAVVIDAEAMGSDVGELVRALRADPAIADTRLAMLLGPATQDEARLLADVALDRAEAATQLLPSLNRLLQAPPAHDQAGLEPVAAPAAPPRRLSILLAEDNLVNQRLASRLLQKQGHSVLVASDGREAVEAFGKARFDLVLMDVQMPQMDGFEATAAIRAIEADGSRRTPIVAMTAHAMKGDEDRCLAAGMDGYVAKPVRLQQLLETMASVLPPPASEAA